MAFKDWLGGLFGKKPASRDNYAATYGNGNAAGFAGGSVGRLTQSMATWSGSVNSDLDGSLVILRARARQLAQSNEYGRRFLSMCAANIVGRSGPKLQVRAYLARPDQNGAPVLDKAANDAIEAHWEKWGCTADITGRMDFPQVCRVAVKGAARDGEALVRKIRNKKLPYGFALQLLESDRLAENMNSATASGVIRQGVEMDTSGRPVALWLRTAHPGETFGNANAYQVERVPVSDIIHLYLPERAEQVRGYTWFHAVLLRAQQLAGFNDAAVVAARIGASKIAALERTEDSIDATASMADGMSGGNLQMNIEAGELFELPPGYKLNSWDPEYPHANYESFVKACMRGIASGLDVSTHNLSGDMTDVNYSSARIAELAERDQWIVLQDWLIHSLVAPVYEEWLSIALLRGDIVFPSGSKLPADKLDKFVNASRFQGRRWRWVDPKKEIDAATAAVDLGITSRTRLAAEQGDDFDDVLDELKQEHDALIAAGLDAEPAEPTPAKDAPEVMAADKMARAQIRAAELNREAAQFMRQPDPAPITVNVAPPAVSVEAPGVIFGATREEIEEIQTRQLDRIESLVNKATDMPINVTVNVPEQPAPTIVNNIEPTPVTLEATITPEISVTLPKRKTETTIQRNIAGDMVGSTAVESDV